MMMAVRGGGGSDGSGVGEEAVKKLMYMGKEKNKN